MKKLILFLLLLGSMFANETVHTVPYLNTSGSVTTHIRIYNRSECAIDIQAKAYDYNGAYTSSRMTMFSNLQPHQSRIINASDLQNKATSQGIVISDWFSAEFIMDCSNGSTLEEDEVYTTAVIDSLKSSLGQRVLTVYRGKHKVSGKGDFVVSYINANPNYRTYAAVFNNSSNDIIVNVSAYPDKTGTEYRATTTLKYNRMTYLWADDLVALLNMPTGTNSFSMKITTDTVESLYPIYTQLTKAGARILPAKIISTDTTPPPPPPSSNSDLIVQSPNVSSTVLSPGESYTVSATVKNQGSGTSASTTLVYYYSTNITISTGDVEMTTDIVDVLASSSTSYENAIVTAPTSSGIYYIGACVVPVSGESITSNNCSGAVAITVKSEPVGTPDLVVLSPGVNDTTLTTSQSFTVNATVKNEGDGTSNSTTLEYYYSTNNVISTFDTKMSTDVVGSLSASATSYESATVNAPSKSGTYYIGACVVSVDGESNTNNNCSTGVAVSVGSSTPTGAPDLVVVSPGVSDTSLDSGQSFTVNATVKNQGDASSSSTTLAYYYSTNDFISTSDTKMSTDSVSSLSPSATSYESATVSAPVSSGTYYIGACVTSVSGELSTSNNCSTGVAVSVGSSTPTGAPDLVVVSPGVSDTSLDSGQSFTVNATVKNQGDASSSSTTLTYYYSTNNVISTFDTKMSTDSVSSLSSGATSYESATVSAPSSSGTYYIGACVTSVSGELSTSNNCSTGVSVSVGSTPPPPPPSSGGLPLIIIRIEYKDFSFKSSASTWYQKIFGSSNGQLNHYFNEVSNGNFKVIPATDSYGSNDGIITVFVNEYHPGDNYKVNKEHFIIALEKANPYINYASYDKDSDGKIRDDELQIMFLVAGGEAAASQNPGVWAHASCLNPTASTSVTDGVLVGHCYYNNKVSGSTAGYSAFGERHGANIDASIGIIAHELGHAIFDLPDLYDTDNSGEGIGNFGLMGAGTWGYQAGEQQGQTPVHMSAWSKLQQAWVSAQEITFSQLNISLFDTYSSSYKPLKINTGRSGEYFLIENRSTNGYDRGLYVLDKSTFLGGMAIWHIDENVKDEYGRFDNSNNSHKAVDLEEANGANLDSGGDRGERRNLFYSGNKTEFTSFTSPSTKRYDGLATGIDVTNISSAGSTMTLDISK